MASIDFNPLRRRFGRVVLRERGDQVFFARAPKRDDSPSPARARRDRVFREAVAYSKAIFDHPVRRVPYAEDAKARNKEVFATIMADFLKAPVIQDLEIGGYHGKVGDPIVVKTRPGLAIALVHVVLRRADGTPIEEGDAAVEYGQFRYVGAEVVPAGTAVVAEVTVTDNDNLELTRKVPFVVA
jgi:hypothetical protein